MKGISKANHEANCSKDLLESFERFQLGCYWAIAEFFPRGKPNGATRIVHLFDSRFVNFNLSDIEIAPMVPEHWVEQCIN